MKRLESTEINIRFVFCPNPITIDMRNQWGEHFENVQHAPNGAFLKINARGEISHLIQPTKDRATPIGWIPGDSPETFSKKAIWVADDELLPGTLLEMQTLDGAITCEIKEPSVVCYNDKHGSPDLNDGWVETIADLKQNYVL